MSFDDSVNLREIGRTSGAIFGGLDAPEARPGELIDYDRAYTFAFRHRGQSNLARAFLEIFTLLEAQGTVHETPQSAARLKKIQTAPIEASREPTTILNPITYF